MVKSATLGGQWSGTMVSREEAEAGDRERPEQPHLGYWREKEQRKSSTQTRERVSFKKLGAVVTDQVSGA